MFEILLSICMGYVVLNLIFFILNISPTEIIMNIIEWIEKKRDKSVDYDDDYLSQYKDWEIQKTHYLQDIDKEEMITIIGQLIKV